MVAVCMTVWLLSGQVFSQRSPWIQRTTQVGLKMAVPGVVTYKLQTPGGRKQTGGFRIQDAI